MALTLTSPAFADNGEIPREHTCDGADTSPPLCWCHVPHNAQSLVLIVDDPDAPDPAAPQMTWVHWVLYNLPAESTGLATGIAVTGLPTGTGVGLNDWKNAGYGGPCPPVGRHRYFHKLYALAVRLPELANPTKAQLEQAMAGEILDHTALVGTYQRR